VNPQEPPVQAGLEGPNAPGVQPPWDSVTNIEFWNTIQMLTRVVTAHVGH